MQVIERMNAIEHRANRINLSLFDLCRAQGLSFSTVTRWRSGGGVRLDTFERFVTALESELAVREAAIRAHLCPGYLSAGGVPQSRI